MRWAPSSTSARSTRASWEPQSRSPTNLRVRPQRGPHTWAEWATVRFPREGAEAGFNRVIDAVRRNVPACSLNDRLKDTGGRVQVGGKDMCLVVNDEGILLGRSRGAAFDRDPETQIEEIMESGPTTVRPDVILADVVERMHRRRVDSILVSNERGLPHRHHVSRRRRMGAGRGRKRLSVGDGSPTREPSP